MLCLSFLEIRLNVTRLRLHITSIRLLDLETFDLEFESTRIDSQNVEFYKIDSICNFYFSFDLFFHKYMLLFFRLTFLERIQYMYFEIKIAYSKENLAEINLYVAVSLHGARNCAKMTRY